MAAIVCTSLHKKYEQGDRVIRALDDVSLTIDAGSFRLPVRTIWIGQDHPAQCHRRTGSRGQR